MVELENPEHGDHRLGYNAPKRRELGNVECNASNLLHSMRKRLIPQITTRSGKVINNLVDEVGNVIR